MSVRASVGPLAALILASPVAPAQTGLRSAPNVQSGTIVSFDSSAQTLTLALPSGATAVYRLTEKTNILRKKQAATADSLKPGDPVTVRFRRSAPAPRPLYDLCDNESWAWLSRIRRQIARVTVKQITEGHMLATEDAGAEISYRITEKTSWERGGKPASSEDFKAGDIVFVAPRMLPSGGVMAVAVSDSERATAVLKERSKPTVTGSLLSVDLAGGEMSIRSVTGDERRLRLASDCVARREGRDAPLSALRPGQSVTAHLTRRGEEREVTRVTIHAKGTPPGRKPLPGPSRPNPPGKRPAAQ